MSGLISSILFMNSFVALVEASPCLSNSLVCTACQATLRRSPTGTGTDVVCMSPSLPPL